MFLKKPSIFESLIKEAGILCLHVNKVYVFCILIRDYRINSNKVYIFCIFDNRSGYNFVNKMYGFCILDKRSGYTLFTCK